jgi:hypothetical protein
MYTFKHISGGRGHGNRTVTSLNILGEVASLRNACEVCHAIGQVQNVQSGLGAPAFQVLATVLASLTLLLHLIASFELEW